MDLYRTPVSVADYDKIIQTIQKSLDKRKIIASLLLLIEQGTKTKSRKITEYMSVHCQSQPFKRNHYRTGLRSKGCKTTTIAHTSSGLYRTTTNFAWPKQREGIQLTNPEA